MTRDSGIINHHHFDRTSADKADTFQKRNGQRAAARRRKIMDHTEIANRFAAFFGGRPIGALSMYEDKPELLAKEQERDAAILAYVAEVCGNPLTAVAQ